MTPEGHRDETLRRRGFLGLAAASCALSLAGAGRAAAVGARRLDFYNLHTEESLSAVFWEAGRLLPDALAAIDYHLRDHRTGDVKAIDPDLLHLLHELGTLLGHGGPIHVISGYRSPATNAMLARRSNRVARNSYHIRGMAIDIRLPGRPLRDVRRAAQSLARGGVGYYPRSDFVHLDTGPVRAW